MHKNNRLRLSLIFVLFAGLFVLSLSRLIYLQLIKNDSLSDIARKQHNLHMALLPRRGSIRDRNMRPLAMSYDVYSAYADSRSIKDKEKVAQELSTLLGMDEEFLLKRLKRDKDFVWIKRKLDSDTTKNIEETKPKGIHLIREEKRFYPRTSLASHIIGFVNIDNDGMEGLELYYDDSLSGKQGYKNVLRDARGKAIDARVDAYLPSVDGHDLVLTIDEVIQYITERELSKAVTQYNAKGGSVVVMDPVTGQILAMANLPMYDLAEAGNSPPDARRNRAITDMLEPGSAFKIVTASTALELEIVDFDDKIFCENGAYKVGSHILHDHKPHGTLTFKKVIEKSSNIGTVKVAQEIGNEKLYEYIKAFGFGETTGIDLRGEIPGLIRPPEKWSKISISAVPIGQEVGVTPLQLACAVSVIANGGSLMRPYVVKEIRDQKGELIRSFEPEVVRQVISAETAGKMRRLLGGVVTSGTGKKAAVKGYEVGGKTGTAQKVMENGAYSHSAFMASFIGFGPVEEPKLVIAVCVDEPRPVYYGGSVAAPIFSRVMKDVLRYLEASPGDARKVVDIR